MYKKQVLLLFFVGMLSAVLAQQTIKNKVVNGQVIDAQSLSGISGVVCKLLDSNGKIVVYTLTNNDGKYNISLKKSAVFVSFSRIGYKKQIFGVQQIKTNQQVVLTPEIEKIDPVTVKIPPIEWKNDTITYNVVSFAGKQDHYLTDVLKKLPGIKVSENGTISYQGKPINKFYIEGQDLMGSHYNQATRSLPMDAISQVQILQNHQHIKALKNIAFTDRAALNVKLKKGYKIKLFGEASGGIGTNTDSFLWDNRLLLAKFKANNQLFFTGKMNNTGQDLSGETTEHINIADLFSYEPLPENIVNTTSGSKAGLKLSRYLRNKSVSGGLNNLIKLSNNSNLRFNLLYYRDKNTYSDSSYYQYGDINTVTISEKNKLIDKTYFVVPELRYENNADNFYIVNDFKTSLSSKKQNNFIINNAQDVNQDIKTEPWYLQNRLKVILKKANKVYIVSSFTRYYDGREDLIFERDYGKGLEKINKEAFFTRNRLSTNFLVFKNQLDLGLLFSLKKENLTGFIDQSTLSPNYNLSYDGLQKTQSRQKYSVGISPKYSISYSSKGRISVKLPMSLDFFETDLHRQTLSKQYPSYAPNITLNHSYGDLLDLKVSASYQNSADNSYIKSLLPVFKDYRTLYVSNLNINKTINGTNTFRLSSTLNYHDLAAMLFMSLSGNYSKKNAPLLTDYIYTEAVTKVRPVLKGNHTESLSVNGTIDKTWVSTGISLKLSGNYSHYKSLFSQNGNSFYNKSNILNGTFTGEFKKYSWFSFFYSFTGSMTWQNNKISNSQRLSVTHHKIDLFLFPTPKINITLSDGYRRIEIAQGKFKQINFLDFQVKYNADKRLNFSFRIANLFNQKDYQIATQNGINYYFYNLPLRERQFLIKVFYRF